MSLKNVQAFYARLGSDEAFRNQMQGVTSKDECSQLVKDAGYDFTQKEFEEYTAQLLESTAGEGELRFNMNNISTDIHSENTTDPDSQPTLLPCSPWNSQLAYLKIIFRAKKALERIEKEAGVLRNEK